MSSVCAVTGRWGDQVVAVTSNGQYTIPSDLDMFLARVMGHETEVVITRTRALRESSSC